MRSLWIALQSLTILRSPKEEALSEHDSSRSLIYFPLAGLIIGVALVFINELTSFLFPPLVAKALVFLALVIFTGALPLSEFAHTAEGFIAGENKKKVLSIMQESRFGSWGTIALVSLVLIKFALLSGLVERVENRALLLMPVIGRWAILVLGTITPYAGEQGRDKPLASEKDYYRSLIIGSILTFVICFLFSLLFVIPLMLIAYIGILVIRNYSLKKAGGITSHILGATIEVTEIGALLMFNLMK